MKNKLVWLGVVILGLLGLGLGWAGWGTYRVYRYFEQRLAVPPRELVETAVKVARENRLEERDWYYLLVLGLDPRDDELEKTQTTDTIMIAGVNMNTAEVRLISIPRDLWLTEEKYKINRLYMEKGDKGLNWVRERMSKLVGVEIDRTVVVKTKNLIDLVGMVGGVEVDMPEKLVDFEYPNPEYVKNPKKGVPMYVRIEYPAGKQVIDETNVEPFVRSRKASGDNGTDLGRIKRQQMLLEAIVAKLTGQGSVLTVDKMIEMVNYWEREVEKDMDWKDIFEVGWRMREVVSKVKLTALTVPVGERKGEGAMYYPGYLVGGQWVFLPSDGNYEALRKFFEINMTSLENRI